MRILLAQKLPYFRSLTGGSKFTKLLLEQLAARNHSCRVLALRSNEANRATSPQEIEIRVCNGVEVHVVSNGLRLNSYLLEQVDAFNPTWTIVSEDPTYGLLNASLHAQPERTILLSQSTATLPFGPEAFEHNRGHAELFTRVAGIIAVSRYLKNYIKRWASIEPWWAPAPVFGNGPFLDLGSFENSFVTMVNPSLIKGISIFLELARRLPKVQFAAVCTWATTPADRFALSEFPNVRILEPDENIENILAQSRVVLVPSLWAEAFGLIVVEAMLRGIPVIASDVGGLREAKLGIDYLLPVVPIKAYEERRDTAMLKVPIVPHQEINPWLDALRRLISDRTHYQELSLASRKVALRYVSALSILPLEQYLESLTPSASRRRESKEDLAGRLQNLSADKLELLAQLMRKNA